MSVGKCNANCKSGGVVGYLWERCVATLPMQNRNLNRFLPRNIFSSIRDRI